MLTRHLLLSGLALLFAGVIVQAQTRISGIVSSAGTNTPLAGVSVHIKGASKGVVTDAGGNFSITANTGDSLAFEYVGYAIKYVAATNNLQVVLDAEQGNLNEVVVTALGISKQRKALGYSVQELKSKDIAEAKETNLVNALAGKVAGVRITNSQGGMGSSRIIIRGETSISNYNQPLFIVDGLPVDNSQLGNTVGTTVATGVNASRDYPNTISDINSDDIESLSVLKGPNAAALYGSRAAHGVVLIKTKTGKPKNGLGVTLTSSTSFENLLTLPKYQDVFGQGSNGQFSYVDGKGGGVNDAVDESWGPKMQGQLVPQFFDGTPQPFVPHPDNVRDYFKTGVTYNNGIAIEDANDKITYRFSYNNLKQTGVTPNSDISKNFFRLNTSLKLAPRLTLNTNVNYIRSYADNLPGAGGIRATSTMLQFTWFGRQVDINKLRDNYNQTGSGLNWNNAYYSNPFFVANQNTVGQQRDRIIGNIGLSYKIAEGLNANFKTGNDYYTDRRKLRIAYGTNGTPFGNYEEDAFTVNENNTELSLTYTKKLSHDFSIDALAAGNIRYKTYSENDQIAPKLAVAGIYTLSNSRDPLVSSSYYSKLKQNSIYGSAQVGFRNYAFVSVTLRNDWSSTLPISSMSYFYPSVNGSFILSDALHLQGNVLSYLKVRGGWAKVGNDTDPYQLQNVYPFVLPTFGGNPQLTAPSKALNPNLKSESVNTTEVGFEAGFFKNRAHLDVSLYHSSSTNQILNIDVSGTTGFTQQVLNGGKLTNKGIEVQAGVTPIKNKDFQWDININFAANKSKLWSLDDAGRLKNYVLGTDRTVSTVAAVGQAYGSLLGNAYTRNSSGQIVVDASGAPVTNPTQQILGKYTPDWIGGITNSFSYKNFNLSVLVDASIGGSLYSNTNSTGAYTGVLALTLPGRDAAHGGLNYYYPGNNTSAKPVQGNAGPNGETIHDDGMIFNGVTADGKANTSILSAQQYYKAVRNFDEAWIYSASYVKLREVKFGYALPAAWIKHIGFQGATVALVGRNLWIIHKNVPNIDPENAFNTGNGQGLEDLSLPSTRSYGINVNLKF
ncbi:SusC/RagA family TonB-linked outer membrane protein [Deminuibacter soli]|uniref:SusC/RagA family TonB-linked outer membrane protein n=1 Tax=Deminuibacter soli TaxID=2291815 RepID=A0A3E1NCF5_9BACT|nr:SusC/RagA family TonB-linked outer membrane protein [Deminuibacter soli]RFM25666.1 SusC/RagA family TonB-linked outer membrane protein [Deminuibacter soli]